MRRRRSVEFQQLKITDRPLDSNRVYSNFIEHPPGPAFIGCNAQQGQRIRDCRHAGMFAKQNASGAAEQGRVECFTAAGIAKKARNMDARFMREGCRADNGFCRRNRTPCDPCHKLGEIGELGEIDRRRPAGNLRECGHDLLKCGISCTLAKA
jgi:hypothetical protein